MGIKRFKRPLLLDVAKISTEGNFILDARAVYVSNSQQQGSGTAFVRILSKDTGDLQELYFGDETANGDFFDISSPGDGTLELYSKPPAGSWRLIGRMGNGNVVVRGDEDTALAVSAGATSAIDKTVVLYDTELTEARAVTLATALAHEGMSWRIVRQATATGAFDLDVGGLKTLGGASEWCDVVFDGTSWVLTAYGAL